MTVRPALFVITVALAFLATVHAQPQADDDRWVAATLKKMTLDDKVGQLLVSSFGSEYLSTDSREYDALVKAIHYTDSMGMAVTLTYDFYDRAERSAVRALAGEAPITGKLPIGLPGLAERGAGLTRTP
jgi:hypothetical protein